MRLGGIDVGVGERTYVSHPTKNNKMVLKMAMELRYLLVIMIPSKDETIVLLENRMDRIHSHSL